MPTPDCKLCDILLALKTISGNATVNGKAVGLDKVTLGYVDPSKVTSGAPRVMIWWDGNIADDIDDYEEHTVRVMLGVLSKSDPSDLTQHESDLLQATATYFSIRTAWVKASRDLAGSGLGTGAGGAGVLHMQPSSGGAEPDGFADHDRATFVGQFFDIKFQQALPA
ncbi:MAG: hypothetical protein AAGA29_05910 [Planctomycetota bacterium]